MNVCQVLPPITTSSSAVESPLEQAVSLALRQSGYMQLQALDIRSDGHSICLRGRLPSYYLKQKAQHVVLNVPGVRVIIDDIDVVNYSVSDQE